MKADNITEQNSSERSDKVSVVAFSNALNSERMVVISTEGTEGVVEEVFGVDVEAVETALEGAVEVDDTIVCATDADEVDIVKAEAVAEAVSVPLPRVLGPESGL